MENRYGLLSDEYYNRKSKLYLQNSFHYADRLKTILKTLDPKKGEKILDIGCGFGSCGIECAKLHCEVTGLDISPKAIKTFEDIAKKLKLNVKGIVSSCTSMPSIKSNSFDKIVCADIIEHLNYEDSLNTFEECKRVLKKGGKLLVYTPNAHHFTEYVRLKKVEGHICVKTMKYLRKTLEALGFKIEKSFYRPSSVKIVRQLDILFGSFLPIFRKRLCVLAVKK
ncbi:MAG: class I SAM-dependent methyltransferase [Nanoarchaeota archaeon]|nr:class I SAM-dependent methyltransferase [Nanoarchaeota archaeon]